MYKVLIAAGAVCAAACPAWSQPTATDSAVARSPHPSLAAARIQALRQQLQAQVAVYDAAENAMRAPSAEEATALAGTAGDASGRFVALGGRGVAMRADPAQASFLVVETQPDGKTVMRHQSAPSRAATATQGGAHVR
jgi:hypothetical protein